MSKSCDWKLSSLSYALMGDFPKSRIQWQDLHQKDLGVGVYDFGLQPLLKGKTTQKSKRGVSKIWNIFKRPLWMIPNKSPIRHN